MLHPDGIRDIKNKEYYLFICIIRRECKIFNCRLNEMELKDKVKEFRCLSKMKGNIREVEVIQLRMCFYRGESSVGKKRNIL
jgi:hypothetical protein